MSRQPSRPPTRPDAKGWCPGAYSPMMSGDGLVVRVRPTMARLTAAQALGLCDLAERHGSGVIDLTNRANLQLRGVRPEEHDTLLAELSALALLPDDPDQEARRNILVPLDWQDGDDTQQITAELTARLAEFPNLPAKFGFAIDAGAAPILTEASADLRIERSMTGLIARADGLALGQSVTVDTAVDTLIEMADWFVQTNGFDAKRMARHLIGQAAPAQWQAIPSLTSGPRPKPGPSRNGAIFGVAFGQMLAKDLRALLIATRCRALRVTPWRLVQTEDAAPIASDAFISQPGHPLLAVNACPGSLGCAAGEFDTRGLARALAGKTKGHLHVSGCAKGCAYPRAADMTLVGLSGKIGLVRNGHPWDDPEYIASVPSDMLDHIGDL